MTRLLGLALLLGCAGCGHPLFVPEAGPNAPGFTARPAPPAPVVVLGPAAPGQGAAPAGGAVDGVRVSQGRLQVTGWALLDEAAPRGQLRVVLPAGARAELGAVAVLPRPDVVGATGQASLAYAGFSIELSSPLQQPPPLCVLSSSSQGVFRLAGSDPALCP